MSKDTLPSMEPVLEWQKLFAVLEAQTELLRRILVSVRSIEEMKRNDPVNR